MLLLALALAAHPAPALAPTFPSSRVFTSRALHVGVRPAAIASPIEGGIGVTVQITL